MNEAFDHHFLQTSTLGFMLIVFVICSHFFEKWQKNRGLSAVDAAIEMPRARGTYYLGAAVSLTVCLIAHFTVFGGAFETFSMVADVVFWMIIGAIFITLVVLLLRYFMLLGGCFSEFQIGDRLNVPPEIEELDESSLPMVTVLVPAYNEDKVIAASVKSLLKLDYPNFEVLVIDDGSRDATFMEAQRAAEEYPDRIRVLTQQNGGKSHALNNGIQNANGDFVLCMDADSTMSPRTLKAMIRHMLFDPGCGAVAGAVKVVNRDMMITRLQALEYIQGLNITRTAFGWAHLVSIIPGPCGLFRRKALFEVGGYDSDTFAEDCDLTLKMLLKGWRVKYEPEAQAWTEAPETLRALYQQRYRWTRGIIQAVMKHRVLLFSPRHGVVNSFVLWYMLFETLIWPMTNMMANLLVLITASIYGVSSLLIIWWLLLTVMDVSISLLAVAMEDEDPIFVPYTILYRLFFTLIVDVCKVLSTFEEFLGVGMNWGKLARVGRI